MFKRVFIANRGEIAVRVVRACREAGLVSIIGHSQADRASLPVMMADERICIGPASPQESYLNIPAIVSAIEATRAEAVHPGYGFLSENVPFVEVCEASGIVFIGPSASTIALMGDKSLARLKVKQIGVPLVPGVDAIADVKKAAALARRIGYPVMLKASGGGGGRGMRVVAGPKEFEQAWQTCREEARRAFDNDSLYLEKFIERPRHIEIQMLADGRGTVLTFPERDCSIQRRHQKLIEETPSPFADDRLRVRLAKYTRKIAMVSRYRSAGTVEFLTDASRSPYFIEMNTRIQVEHPVTEMVTGVDLVRAQFAVALGEKLGMTQRDIRCWGHAIECRINAEDPLRGFLPSPGRITRLVLPGGPGIRVDTHLFQGYEVPAFYDSLLAKLIAHGPTRQIAIERMQRALDECVIEGVKTTLPLHRAVVRHPIFVTGRYYVGWLEKVLANGLLSGAHGG